MVCRGGFGDGGGALPAIPALGATEQGQGFGRGTHARGMSAGEIAAVGRLAGEEDASIVRL
jgi:hypothetical protein